MFFFPRNIVLKSMFLNIYNCVYKLAILKSSHISWYYINVMRYVTDRVWYSVYVLVVVLNCYMNDVVPIASTTNSANSGNDSNG